MKIKIYNCFIDSTWVAVQTTSVETVLVVMIYVNYYVYRV